MCKDTHSQFATGKSIDFFFLLEMPHCKKPWPGFPLVPFTGIQKCCTSSGHYLHFPAAQFRLSLLLCLSNLCLHRPTLAKFGQMKMEGMERGALEAFWSKLFHGICLVIPSQKEELGWLFLLSIC